MRIFINGNKVGFKSFNLNKTEVIPFNSRYFQEKDCEIIESENIKNKYIRLAIFLALIGLCCMANPLLFTTETLIQKEIALTSYNITKTVAKSACVVGFISELR